MVKGFASLSAGLVARRAPPAVTPEPAPPPPPPPADEVPEPPPSARVVPRLVVSEGQSLTASAGLTADLISAGRAAYRAERQRLAEKAMWLSPDGTAISSTPAPAPAPSPPPVPRGPTVRDVAGAQPMTSPVTPMRPSMPLSDLMTPAVPAPVEPVRRRRAVTLRLRPDQHVRLLGVRRKLGCSFQVLVVRALVDFLDRLERDAPTEGGGAVAGLRATSPVAPIGKLPPDVHFFTLPSGWCVAAWHPGRGNNEATPSEVLGQVLREQGVADLISAAGGDVVPESISLGDQGRRLALTIRLESDLHTRLLAARDRLGRTGQDILMQSIDAYLTV